MHRLVQGDVGSGKTAVALSAAAYVAEQGAQAAIMAPTELLAEQHMRNALKTLAPQGIRVALLTGKLSAQERRDVLSQLENGEVQCVIGTHALIQDSVKFNKLALGIVDEQHRFGVLQRAKFVEMGLQSAGAVPHMLVAAVIPRTLASPFMELMSTIDGSHLVGRRSRPMSSRIVKGQKFFARSFVRLRRGDRPMLSSLWLRSQIRKGSRIFAMRLAPPRSLRMGI